MKLVLPLNISTLGKHMHPHRKGWPWFGSVFSLNLLHDPLLTDKNATISHKIHIRLISYLINMTTRWHRHCISDHSIHLNFTYIWQLPFSKLVNHIITLFSRLGSFLHVTYNVNEMTFWDEMRTSTLCKLPWMVLTHTPLTFTSFAICNQSLLSKTHLLHMLYSCMLNKMQQVL